MMQSPQANLLGCCSADCLQSLLVTNKDGPPQSPWGLARNLPRYVVHLRRQTAPGIVIIVAVVAVGIPRLAPIRIGFTLGTCSIRRSKR
jgi:hypothetical protein